MVAWILYLGATVTVGFVVGFLIGLFRAGQNEGKPFRSFGICIFLAMALPFAWCEILTKIGGTNLGLAVKKIYPELPINGDLAYYKITSLQKDQAKVLVIGKETDKWNAEDHVVVEASLSLKNNSWGLDKYKVLHSERLGKDESTFPPYR